MNCWSPSSGPNSSWSTQNQSIFHRPVSGLNKLLDEAIGERQMSRRDLFSILRDRYKDYKRAQLLAEARKRSV